MIGQAKRDQVLYREVQTAYGHAPVPRLYLMREIYVADCGGSGFLDSGIS